MKNILILNAHPNPHSFSHSLAQSYYKGATAAGATCELVNLIDLDFDPNLHGGYRKRTELEPDLIRMQAAITKADHLVFVYPNWWASFPAILKGFIDRVFLPGFAFKSRENSVFIDKLLSGKTARLIVTMDSPSWYYRFFTRQPGHNAMRIGTLEFCGIKPVKITSFSPIKTANEAQLTKWLVRVEAMGKHLK
jgi:putative NADPH-quinone reductase